jgi:hypothetical protein
VPARTHECPGGCGTRVERTRFSCRSCWYRLPEKLRDRIRQAHHRNSEEHYVAMANARDWYADHPLSTPHGM